MNERSSITFSRNASLAAAAILLAAVAWSVLSLHEHPAFGQGLPGGGASGPGNPAFARSVAGTWGEPGDGFSTILNIGADGTLGWYGSWFFGDGSGAFYDGPVYGTWRQIGPFTMETIELGHLFNGDGSFFATGRVREVFEFSPDFQSFNYSGEEDLFAPDQDPTDPDAVPFDTFDFAGGPFNRLNHMD